MNLMKIMEQRVFSNETNIAKDTLLRIGIQSQFTNGENRPIYNIFDDLCKVFRKFNIANLNDDSAIIKNEYWYEGESIYQNPDETEKTITQRKIQMFEICQSLVGIRNANKLYSILSKIAFNNEAIPSLDF